MSIWNEQMSRDVALSQWRTHQIVLAVWIFLTVALPLIWGRNPSLVEILLVLLIMVLPLALVLEFGRRQMNRIINEDACKWIWQK